MKREKLNTLSERDLLIGLITSDKFCREVLPALNPRTLEIQYTSIIASWIKDFYDKFRFAPKKDIIKLYRSHVDEISDESLQENILTFIEKIDRDYEDLKSFNVDYAISQSIKYLKTRSLKNLADDINAFVTTGEIEKAETKITKYKTIEKSESEVVSIINNPEAINVAFSERDEDLFSIPNAYGKVIGKIHREDFISFLAPPKRGKTWILMDIGVRALQAGLKILFVSLEMSEGDIIKRFWTCLTGENYISRDDVSRPYFEPAGNKFIVKHKTITTKSVDLSEVENTQKNLKIMFKGGDIRILSVPAYSLTCEQLDVKLERMAQQENYVPDVIIVDYADIMAPSEKGEYRNQLDGIWKRLRSLAQKRKAVVFTASQSGRDSVNKKDVNVTNIAEDFRKVAHATSFVSLNQSEIERKNGILRLKQLALREGEMEFRQAVCTQCLSIGRIIIDSKFEDEVILNFENDSNSGEEPERNKRKI